MLKYGLIAVITEGPVWKEEKEDEGRDGILAAGEGTEKSSMAASMTARLSRAVTYRRPCISD